MALPAYCRSERLLAPALREREPNATSRAAWEMATNVWDCILVNIWR